MTLTALAGALVALVARPKEPQRTKDQEEIERLKRSHAQLIGRIETLELDNEGLGRELAAERRLLTHWIGEASRFAREAREQRERQQSSMSLYAQYHDALRREMIGLAQSQQGMYQALAQSQQGQQVAFGGFCNCVPSRHQMFGVMAGADGLVEQLNQLGR
jgi:predicted RNase H-like nuclease (RuvC/YqgF family)